MSANNKILVSIFAILAVVALLLLGVKVLKKPIPQQSTTTSESQVTNNAVITVNVTKAGFEPPDISVDAGTRVVWVNNSGKAVAINSDDHPTHSKYAPLNLGEIPAGSSVELLFAQPGIYTYHNHLNPTQKGLVEVEEFTLQD